MEQNEINTDNKQFSNSDLISDLERILSYNKPISVGKAFDSNLEHPFAIDVEENSFFYANGEDRDSDYKLLINILRNQS